MSYRSFLPSPVFFAAQRFSRPNCITAGQNNIRDLFVYPLFHIFSRNDVSGQCLRGAEGESSPQSPPAGAFLLKKKIVFELFSVIFVQILMKFYRNFAVMLEMLKFSDFFEFSR